MDMRRSMLLAVALALAAVACTGRPAVKATGTLRLTGGFSNASQPGVPGQVVFERNGRRVTATAESDGSFSANLKSGTYTVTGTSPRYVDGHGLCRTDAPVVVTSTDVTGIVVACSRR